MLLLGFIIKNVLLFFYIFSVDIHSYVYIFCLLLPVGIMLHQQSIREESKRALNRAVGNKSFGTALSVGMVQKHMTLPIWSYYVFNRDTQKCTMLLMQHRSRNNFKQMSK